MIEFPVHIFIGWQWRAPRQHRRQPPSPQVAKVDPLGIDLAGRYAGSYHVLELGQHFEAYTDPGARSPFPFAPQLPSWVPADPLLERNRAADITGNIGETIAGLVAKRIFRVRPRSIVHLRTRERRTPDYLLLDVPQLQAYVSGLAHVRLARLPLHWPMESKAGIGALGRSESEQALRQLVAYWIDISQRYRQGVGYGVIVTTELNPPRVTLAIIMPRGKRRARRLRAYLRSRRSYDRFCAASGDLRPIMACLRGFHG